MEGLKKEVTLTTAAMAFIGLGVIVAREGTYLEGGALALIGCAILAVKYFIRE